MKFALFALFVIVGTASAAPLSETVYQTAMAKAAEFTPQLTSTIANFSNMLAQAAEFVKNSVSNALEGFNAQRKVLRDNAINILKNARGQIDDQLIKFSGAEDSLINILKEKADKIVNVLENVKIEEPQSEVLKKLWPHVAPVLESMKGKANAAVATLYARGAEFITMVKPTLDEAAKATAEELKKTLDTLVDQAGQVDKMADAEAADFKKAIEANEERAQKLIKELGGKLANAVPKN
ncbi:uncharacterized protein LOC141854952 [Brevipalpus obovatus]|uniref:uncharacterized protein LOC141854950 n=1 Tax=Brevipalpus obovatus TaxID=246614 RepID=UPI003D9E0326